MIRIVLALLACAGCERVLGLNATHYDPTAPDATVTATADAAPDACGASCQTFRTCSDLLASYPTAPSGVYRLDAGTGPFRAYCDQTGDAGGWTLALKADGSAQTFSYDAAIWENADLLAPDSPDLDHTEAKLETWNAVPFTAVRIGLEYQAGSPPNWLVVPLSGAKLSDLFAPGAQFTTTLGRDAWKGLLGTSASLQVNCNAEGTNVGNSASRVRIGIVSNQEADCQSPDSRIGIGGADSGQCGTSPTESTGNTACFTADNGDVEHAVFGWVMVR